MQCLLFSVQEDDMVSRFYIVHNPLTFECGRSEACLWGFNGPLDFTVLGELIPYIHLESDLDLCGNFQIALYFYS
jgi:hypothetical protein